jgi:hypothetical protein
MVKEAFKPEQIINKLCEADETLLSVSWENRCKDRFKGYEVDRYP